MSDIALMVQRTTGGSIAPSANLIFDTVSYVSGSISYNPLNGVITFTDPGRYSVNWWVAAQSSQATNGAAFSFNTSESVELVGNSPIKTDEVVGFTVFDVITAPATASLVCDSNAAVYLSSHVSVKASMTVFQLEGTGGGEAATIIPYSSGEAVAVTSLIGGLVGLPAVMGFGGSAQSPSILGAVLDIFGMRNYAFSMPRSGFLTELALYFSNTLSLSLLGTINLRGEIYRSAAPDDNFTATGVAVDIPIPGILGIGDTYNGIATGFSVPVNAQDRILMVLSTTTTGIALASTLTGQFSAGLTILS